MINIIVCMDKNGLIGNGNKLPWHLPEDLKYFKKITTGKIVVMGRKTWDSLPKKPLPNRTNVVLTKINKKQFNEMKDVLSYQTIESIIDWSNEGEEIFIIGGANIYKAFYPHCDKLYITYVNDIYEGDVYFPIKITQINEDFEIESRKIKNDKCEFIVMRRKYEEN